MKPLEKRSTISCIDTNLHFLWQKDKKSWKSYSKSLLSRQRQRDWGVNTKTDLSPAWTKKALQRNSRMLWDAHPAMEMQLLSCLRAQGWIYKTALHTRHRCFVLLLNTPLTFLFSRLLFDFPLFFCQKPKTFAEKLKDSLKEDERERDRMKTLHTLTDTLQKSLINL